MLALKAQFFDHGERAHRHFKTDRLSNTEAWSKSIAQTSGAAARARHPIDAIGPVISEYYATAAAGSVIERNFGRLKNILANIAISQKIRIQTCQWF